MSTPEGSTTDSSSSGPEIERIEWNEQASSSAPSASDSIVVEFRKKPLHFSTPCLPNKLSDNQNHLLSQIVDDAKEVLWCWDVYPLQLPSTTFPPPPSVPNQRNGQFFLFFFSSFPWHTSFLCAFQHHLLNCLYLLRIRMNWIPFVFFLSFSLSLFLSFSFSLSLSFFLSFFLS